MKSCESSWQFLEAGASLFLTESKPPHEIAPNEIIVLNQFASINPVDWKFIEINPLKWKIGHIPGVDGAGVVVRTGSAVPVGMLGKRVCYHQSLTKNGSFSSYTVLKYTRVLIVPDKLPLIKAAILPCPMLTAIQSIQKLPSLTDRNILIAGYGSVAKILIQILKTKGASIDLLSNFAPPDEAEMYGVNKTFRRREDISGRYFAVLDLRGHESASDLASQLRANGHLVCIQDRIEAPIFKPFSNAISYHEVALGALHEYGDEQDWSELIFAGEQYMKGLSDSNYISESPDTFTISEINLALTHSKQTKRKTVVEYNL
ncbi:alcohol dehydrogenase catalytic domain-containing protein [Pseudoalteromonas gelatinilytica]